MTFTNVRSENAKLTPGVTSRSGCRLCLRSRVAAESSGRENATSVGVKRVRHFGSLLGGIGAGYLSAGQSLAADLGDLPDLPAPPSADLSFLADNPALVGGVGGVALIGIIAGIALSSGDKGGVKASSASVVFGLLEESPDVVFVDIRSKAAIKQSGSPPGVKAKCNSLPYTKLTKNGVEVDAGFGEKFAKIRGLKEDSVVVLLDSDGTDAPKAAKEILTLLDIKNILYVSGGSDGRRGWKESDLPWREPGAGFKFSFPSIDLKGVDLDLDSVAESYKENPSLYNAGLALGAIATASVLVINEIDVILEVVGVVGALNIAARKLFFAKDRKETLEQLDSLLKDKIVAEDAGRDLKRLASTILEAEEEATAQKPAVGAVKAEKPAAKEPTDPFFPSAPAQTEYNSPEPVTPAAENGGD